VSVAIGAICDFDLLVMERVREPYEGFGVGLMIGFVLHSGRIITRWRQSCMWLERTNNE